MWRPIGAVCLSLCLSLAWCLNGYGQIPPSDSDSQSFVLTKRQLDAIKYLMDHRMKLEYTWHLGKGSSSAPWEPACSTPLDESEWRGKVPIYYVKGHTWLTYDGVLETLLEFPDIRTVNIAYCCNVTDDGIAHLAKLKSLRHLVMYRNSGRFGGMGLEVVRPEAVEKMPQRLTDRAIEHICGMKQLESLFIWDNEFSEQAILKLGQVKTLKRLGIRENQISHEGLVRLREMLPACEFDGIGVDTLRATDPAPKEKQQQMPE